MQKLFAAIQGSRVDSENGILRGVSIITEGEAKGHKMRIDSTTLEQVRNAAETHKGGVQVKTNHGTGFESIVGVLRDFVIDGIQLRGDLHLLKTHADYSRILEMSQTMPEAFGLSIAFSGIHETIKGVKYARCSELYSVDLVDAPAANPSGLFSAQVDTNNKGKGMLEKFDQLTDKFLSRFAKVEELESKLSASLTEAQTIKAQLDAKTGELSALQNKVAELESAALKSAEDHKTALEAAKAEATNVIASQAIPPVQVNLEQGKKIASATATRAQFNEMTPENRMAFVKSGGRIVS